MKGDPDLIRRKGGLLSEVSFRRKGYLLFFILFLMVFASQRPSTAEQESPYKFVPGERTVYHLKYESSSSSDLRALFADEKTSQTGQNGPPPMLVNSFTTTVRATYATTVLDKTADGVLVAFSLRDSSITLIANGQKAADQAEAIKHDLSRDIFALLSFQGRVRSLWIDPNISSLSNSFARTLIAMAQFVFPDSYIPESGQWETNEDDPNGQYVSGYRVEQAAGKKTTQPSPAFLKTFRKTKIRYLQPQKKPMQNTVTILPTLVPKGFITATFDFHNGSLVSLNGTESQSIFINKKKVAYAKNSLRMSFVKRETVDSQGLSSIREALYMRQKVTTTLSLYAPPSEEESEIPMQKKELGDATLEGLLAELKELEQAVAKDPKTKTTPLFLKIKALIYLHPESCKHLGNILSTASADSLTLNLLATALASVGHPEAQAALVAAIRARPDDQAALFALLSVMGTLSKATPSTEEAVSDLAFRSDDQRIASMAQLALGSIANNLAETSPEQSKKIVDRFIKEIESSTSPENTRTFLLVLGNSGSTHALPTISRFVADPAPELRSAAVNALRFIESSQAEALLNEALASDPDSDVRKEAATALGFREMTSSSFQSQKLAFLKDTAVSVRLTVLKNLWKFHEAFPEIRSLVKEAAEKDPAEEIRKAAADIMSKYPKSYFSEKK